MKSDTDKPIIDNIYMLFFNKYLATIEIEHIIITINNRLISITFHA